MIRSSGVFAAGGENPFGESAGRFEVLHVVHQLQGCSGVLLRSRLLQNCSRFGASKFDMNGGGAVRLKNVYRLRR